MSAEPISLDAQLEEAELHALGLRDFVDRFTGSKKRSQDEVDRKRQRLQVANATVATLRRLAAEAGRARA